MNIKLGEIFRKGLLTVLLLAVVLFNTASCLADAETSIGRNSPEDVVSQYFTFLKDGQCHEAYAMTSESFRADVSEEFYYNYDFVSMITDSLVSYEVGEALINSNAAVVPVALKIRVSGAEEPIDIPYDLSLLKEDDHWRINLSGYDYLAYSSWLQAPLAVSEYKDVSIALQFILMVEKENSDSPALTHVHLNIQNNSSGTVKWVLPVQDTEGCYLADLANGQKYHLSRAIGYKTEGNFRYADSEDINFIFLNPFSESSLILVFKSVPEATGKFDLFLSGFRFSDTGEEWNITFSDVAFIHDTVSE